MAGGPSPRKSSPTSNSTQSGQTSSALASSTSSSTSTADTSPPAAPALANLGQSSFPQKAQPKAHLSTTLKAGSHRANSMAADVASASQALNPPHFSLSSISERGVLDQGIMSQGNNAKSSASMLGVGRLQSSMASGIDRDHLPTVLIRRLPRSINIEMLNTMLLFAKDLVDVGFVDVDQAEDFGLVAALARFVSLGGAHEAKDRLHGKTLAGDVKLAVDLHPQGVSLPPLRRNTVDGITLRNNTSSASLASLNGNTRSRFNGTFQNLDRLSPSAETFSGQLDTNSHIQSLFSPQSPIGNNAVSSKFMINDDPTDETGRLLKDPVAFAMSGDSYASTTVNRRPTNAQIPVSRFAGLSLNTVNGLDSSGHVISPPLSGFVSPRSQSTSHTPASAMSPTGVAGMHSFGLQSQYNMPSPHLNYGRHNYPPANPADQNPPCNTLYVGNLPMDTSEDELKAVFSKQRGYKRLCFRTKQNGPMCFVEFEDISCATRALNELYGHPLHNSVKGGIRLSFSKNPLGVRNGQNSAPTIGSTMMGPNGYMIMTGNSMTPHSATPMGLPGAFGGVINANMTAPPGFPSSAGAPPGLNLPPGFAATGLGTLNVSSTGEYGMYSSASPVQRGGLGVGGSYRGMLANEYNTYM